jgi:aminopeptidase N
MVLEGELLQAESTAMRVFDLSLSDQLIETQAESRSGVPILVYSYPEHASPAAYAAQAAADSVELFSQLLGPYPYAALTLVEADVFDGRESSGIFYLSDGYYEEHQLFSWSWLSVLVPHETAHQWFFSQVGNQSAFEPWLDEALCTYMERIYFERLKPDRVEWWWDFRVYAFSPEGWVDGTIYDFNTYRRYINAVYLRGVLFLERLRLIIGEQAFFELLAAYVDQNQGQIATREDFFSLVNQMSDRDYSDLMAEYFQRYP